MAFTTLHFFLFAAVVIALYYLLPLKQYQWLVLLAADYYFYLCAGYKYVFFILFTTVTVYMAARKIESVQLQSKAELRENAKEWSREEKKAHRTRVKRELNIWLILALTANFGILIFLKYYNFLAGGLNLLFSHTETGGPLPALRLLLPLGISFYTFQATGYLIDVKRGVVGAEKNFLKFALFISFFPQIVQGPISSFGQLAGQLTAQHKPEFVRFKLGLELILWGMFKKLVIADRALTAIKPVMKNYTVYSGTVILAAALLYALQLYADFSAGIDISRGISQILGIDMVQNFRRPYFAESINEYWRRWHITLGAWMKNYIFNPIAISGLFLGWSKKLRKSRFGRTPAGAHIAKVLPAALSSVIVFLLVGLWHGANSKYIAFGLWNGGIIMISIFMRPVFDRSCEVLRIRAESLGWRVFRILRTFLLVLIGYYFDIAPNLAGAMDMIKRSLLIRFDTAGIDQIFRMGLYKRDFLILAVGMIVMFIVSVREEKYGIDTPGELLEHRSFPVRFGVILLTALAIVVWGVYGPGYNPADFVYMQF